jgi:protein-S-isoprenylcysteine O-methyltransferase Ste14
VNLLDRIRSMFLRCAGYFIPFVQSLPPLGIWTSLMTLPFATYLVMMFTNLPASLPSALSEFFTPLLIIEKTLLTIGFIILVYSIVHLEMRKKRGLVTSGPYRIVRHPQYFGIILSTLGLTSWSVWILNNTFGIGFLNPLQTIGVWLIELFAYALLANIEELYLTKIHGAAFKNYKSRVPFLIPFFNTERKFLDILISILIPPILLYILVSIHHI